MQDLKLLNLKRWQDHVDALGSNGVALEPSQREVPTAGVLFNLPNPRNNGKFVRPYERTKDEQEPMRGRETWVSPRNYRRVDRPSNPEDWQATRKAVPQYGRDWTSVSVASVHKYRIPVTSVVRKRGDLRLCCCFGWRLSSAQWLWFLNLICFFAHSIMIYATLYFAYFRHGRNWLTDTEHLMIPIYRIRTIPTQFMLDNNMSRWSDGWNSSLTRDDEPNSGLFLYDNGMPVRLHSNTRSGWRPLPLPLPFECCKLHCAQINFATLIIAFFATSALFHFWALVAGAFER